MTRKGQEETKEQVETVIEEKMANTAQISIAEIQEREKRKQNLVLFNIPESNKSESEDILKDAHEEVDKIMVKIGTPSEIISLTRLGKKGSTPRPVKIKLKLESDKTRILKSAKKLKGTNTFINRDVTPSERPEFRKLVMERKRRQEESASKGQEAHWIIRRGKVINAARPDMLEEDRDLSVLSA